MSQSFDSLIKMAIHSHHSHCFLYFLHPQPPHTPFLLDKCKECWDEIDVGQFLFLVWDDGWELSMEFLLLEHGASMQIFFK